jgi:hypothetical protein
MQAHRGASIAWGRRPLQQYHHGVNGSRQSLERSIGGLDHFYVAERSRTLFVRVPKAACTTLLWGFLELEGHAPALMARSRKPLLSTPELVVHDRGLYPVPTLKSVTPELRHEALTSPDWLRMAVVRNPYARLYSAWESKVLTIPPGINRFHKTPELVAAGDGVDVGASFRAFVAALAENPKWWMSERHFGRQADLVPVAAIDNLELVPTSAIPALFDRLSDRAGVHVTPRRSNEGLGIDGTTLLDDKTAALISDLYAVDFELTGADPGAYEPGDPVILNTLALNLLRLAGARSRRVEQLDLAYRQLPESKPRELFGRVARRFSRNAPGVGKRDDPFTDVPQAGPQSRDAPKLPGHGRNVGGTMGLQRLVERHLPGARKTGPVEQTSTPVDWDNLPRHDQEALDGPDWALEGKV